MADTKSKKPLQPAAITSDALDSTSVASAVAAVGDTHAAATVSADDASDSTQDATATHAAPDASAAPPVDDELEDAAEGDTTMNAGGTSPSPATNDTPATGKKDKDNKRRKSSVPEHNKKTPSKKKGAAKELHLNVHPGEFWWVRVKGYPIWPAIICDEEMLPNSLIEKRPVSAMGLDGKYRWDFQDGGKNVRDRRYPVMYLGTNEFGWIVNTDLAPLDMDQIKKELEADNRGKKPVKLWEAFKVAVEEHDLEWFKRMLIDHEEGVREMAEQKIKEDEERADKEKEKEAKKQARLSKGGKDEDGDTSMMGTESAPKKKAEKRKKSMGDAGDDEQAPKKAKIKLNMKAMDDSNVDTPDKKPAAKKTSKVTKKKEGLTSKSDEPEFQTQDRHEHREKKLLYLRHRLQKGFLSRDQAPKEDEMETMDGYFTQITDMGELEPGMIRNTKINKVLKAILKLDHIPKEAEYKFLSRCNALLSAWNKALGVAGDTPTTAEHLKPATNGASKEDTPPKNGEAKDESMGDAPEATPAAEADKTDVDMADADGSETAATPAVSGAAMDSA